MQRTMYCLSDAAGRYLADLTADGPTLSLIAADALVSRFAWISSTRAVEALHQAQASCPGLQLGIALLELRARGAGQWQVVSTRLFAPAPSPHQPEPLIR